MQNLKISDVVANQLNDLAKHEHISASQLMEKLVKAHKEKITNRDELKKFFKPYEIDLTDYKFNRKEANER